MRCPFVAVKVYSSFSPALLILPDCEMPSSSAFVMVVGVTAWKLYELAELNVPLLTAKT